MKDLVVATRTDLKVATNAWREAVSRLAEYVDPGGEKSTGPKGLAIQVQRRIKNAFGSGYDALDQVGHVSVEALMFRLCVISDRGQEQGQTRRAIKDAVYAAITRAGECYQADQETFNV